MENSARSFSLGCMVGCRDSSSTNPRVTGPDYPFANPPAPGTTMQVAPGVHWLRMALPFALDHINLWALEDDGAWLLIDTGLGNEPTRALWDRIFAEKLVTRPVKRVLVTHYHPDHAGNAAWLCKRSGAELWMSRGEFLTVHAARNSSARPTPVSNRNATTARSSSPRRSTSTSRCFRRAICCRCRSRSASTRRSPRRA